MNAQIIKDCEALARQLDLRFLEGKKLLVTGGTGMIGQNLILTALKWNELRAEKPIGVIALVRNRQKAEDLFGDAPAVSWVTGDVTSADLSGIRPDYIIHAASQTDSKSFLEKPVETIATALDGTKNLLNCAKNAGVKKFLYLSTMEVYGRPQDDEPIREDHPTDLNTMDVRSCYPISKRMCENLCVCYQAEYKVPVSILRLTQTFGPGVGYQDRRVFAEFARCVIEKKDIVLKTAGETKRKYLYTADAVSAIFTVLRSGVPGEAYNAANDGTYCSILEMANLVAEKVANGEIAVRIEPDDISKYGYSPKLNMNLDTAKIRALGWQAEYTLPEMFRNLISGMKESSSQ